jgi:hypothetical protein
MLGRRLRTMTARTTASTPLFMLFSGSYNIHDTVAWAKSTYQTIVLHTVYPNESNEKNITVRRGTLDSLSFKPLGKRSCFQILIRIQIQLDHRIPITIRIQAGKGVPEAKKGNRKFKNLSL